MKKAIRSKKSPVHSFKGGSCRSILLTNLLHISSSAYEGMASPVPLVHQDSRYKVLFFAAAVFKSYTSMLVGSSGAVPTPSLLSETFILFTLIFPVLFADYLQLSLVFGLA